MIIITGGAGFIGSTTVERLECAGFEKLVVCDFMGNDARWKNIAKRAISDIVSPQNLAEYLRANASEISAVVHLGAVSSTTETDVDLIVRTNIALTLELRKFCAENGSQFVYASSAATYGAGEYGFEDREDTEYLSKLRPLNAYGWSKAFADAQIVRLAKEKISAPGQTVGLKFFNVYGPNEYHKGGQQSVVSHAYSQIKKHGAVKLFKSYRDDVPDGEQRRDFVWAGDVADIIVWFLNHPKKNGLFNVGSGTAESFNALVKSVFAALGKTPEIEYIDMPAPLREKYQYFTRANISKLRSAGYETPVTPLAKGVAEYVLKYLSAPDPYL